MNTPGKVKLGRIQGAFGIQGWVNFTPYVDAEFAWDKIDGVEVVTQDKVWRQLTLLEARPHKPLRLHFHEIADRNAAEALKNHEVWIDAAFLPPLSPGRFYEFQLENVPVFLENGEKLGVVRQILHSGPTPLLEITDGSREILIPLNAANVQSLDSEKIVVHPLEGLLDLNM